MSTKIQTQVKKELNSLEKINKSSIFNSTIEIIIYVSICFDSKNNKNHASEK